MKGNELRQAYLNFFEKQTTFNLRQFFLNSGKRSFVVINRRRHGTVKTVLYG